MDSGVETGNDSNDSPAVPQSPALTVSLNSSREAAQEFYQKIELYFKKYFPVSNSMTIESPLGNSRTRTESNNLSVVRSQNNNSFLTQSMEFMNVFGNIFQSKDLASFKFNIPDDCPFNFSKDEFPSGLTKEACTRLATRHEYTAKMKSKYNIARRRAASDCKIFHPNKDKVVRAAVITNNIELLERLLKQGTLSPNNADPLGRTLLHLAASRGYTEIVRLLLEHGADPNLRDRIGNTPLHLAAVSSNTELVDLLLRAGTNVTSTDQFGNNPLDLAITKLRVLQNCKDANIDSVKEEVKNIISLLKEYLEKSNAGAQEVEILSEICSRLSLSNSTDQIQDDLKSLLSNLDSLNLSK